MISFCQWSRSKFVVWLFWQASVRNVSWKQLRSNSIYCPFTIPFGIELHSPPWYLSSDSLLCWLYQHTVQLRAHTFKWPMMHVCLSPLNDQWSNVIFLLFDASEHIRLHTVGCRI